jgi:hypothetical protein
MPHDVDLSLKLRFEELQVLLGGDVVMDCIEDFGRDAFGGLAVDVGVGQRVGQGKSVSRWRLRQCAPQPGAAEGPVRNRPSRVHSLSVAELDLQPDRAVNGAGTSLPSEFGFEVLREAHQQIRKAGAPGRIEPGRTIDQHDDSGRPCLVIVVASPRSAASTTAEREALASRNRSALTSNSHL